MPRWEQVTPQDRLRIRLSTITITTPTPIIIMRDTKSPDLGHYSLMIRLRLVSERDLLHE